MQLKSVFDLDDQRRNRLSSELIFISIYEDESADFYWPILATFYKKIWYDRKRGL